MSIPKNDDTGAAPLCLDDATRRLRQNDVELTKLELDGCEITKRVDRRKFRNALARNHQLQELNLSQNQLSTWPTDQLYRLFDSIASCQFLCKLKISLNGLDSAAARYLAHALRQKADDESIRNLDSIDLSFNAIGNVGSAALADTILSRDSVASSLQELALQGNEIGDEGAMVLSRCLRHPSSHLTMLSLSQNQIKVAGCRALAQALPHSHLEALVLNFNQVGDEGAVALGLALASNPPLQVLHLRKNNVGPRGARALAQGLRSNSNLKELDLSFRNPIGSSGIQALTQAVKHHNVTLRKLPLWNRYRSESTELQFYVKLNRMGRQHVGDVTIPLEVWPLALARVSGDCRLLYHFVRSRPDMLQDRTKR